MRIVDVLTLTDDLPVIINKLIFGRVDEVISMYGIPKRNKIYPAIDIADWLASETIQMANGCNHYEQGFMHALDVLRDMLEKHGYILTPEGEVIKENDIKEGNNAANV